MKIRHYPGTQHTLNRKSGFSLIEILIVIALIAVLATVAIGNLGGIFGGQQEKVAELFVNQTLKTALTPYRLDVGNYPSTEEGLNALVKAPAGKESNWLQTVPKKGWFCVLRLYSPTEPWFDKTWRPGEIELVK